jgi:nucleoside-diphosphate-sugar epimerase
MEIWLGPALGFDYARAKAVIYGEGKNKISWIAIKDVASFAVTSIDNPAAQNAVIQLGGPDDLSVLDAVEFLSRKADRHLNYRTYRMKRCWRRSLQLRIRGVKHLAD